MIEHARKVSELLKAIANENRLIILCVLLEKELSVNEIHKYVPNITQPALSQHLNYLLKHECIKCRKDGQHVLYSIKDEHLKALFNTIKKEYCQ